MRYRTCHVNNTARDCSVPQHRRRSSRGLVCLLGSQVLELCPTRHRPAQTCAFGELCPLDVHSASLTSSGNVSICRKDGYTTSAMGWRVTSGYNSGRNC